MDAIDSVHLYGEAIQIEKGDLFTEEYQPEFRQQQQSRGHVVHTTNRQIRRDAADSLNSVTHLTYYLRETPALL